MGRGSRGEGEGVGRVREKTLESLLFISSVNKPIGVVAYFGPLGSRLHEHKDTPNYRLEF